MKLSTKARYGTRALVELGTVYPGEAVSVRRVAEKLDLSVKYLEQIMSSLKAAGLVTAIRGVNGGYALARDPGQVRLLDIFKVLEGTPVLVECLEKPGTCPLDETCPTQSVWREMNDALTRILAETTIKALMDRAQENRLSRTRMYHI